MFRKLKKIPVPIIFSWVLKFILLCLCFFEIFQHNLLVAFGALAALILSLLPSYFFKSYYITLPRLVESSVTLALFLHVVGVSFYLYHDPDFWWWDNMTHFLGTAVIALLAFMFVFTLNYLGKIKMTANLLLVFTFCVAVAIGSLWEVAEFYFDKLFKTSSLGDLYDTIDDMQFNAIGGMVVAVWAYFYKKAFTKRQQTKGVKEGEVSLK